MARMPDSFLDCVVTSPPYYGLRSYGTEPQIWGGNEFCDHVWGEAMPFAKQDNRTLEEKIAQGASVGSNQKFNNENTTASSGNFCQLCNAWRGELGLEPTFQLYISHLIDIFREVKRVLKKTGTVWVNLGDSYAGTGSKGDWLDPKYPNGRNGQSVSITQNVEGLRSKSLLNIPSRFAIAMTDELQFIQRNNIIWHKPACMPSSAKDRFTVDFENIFFFTKEPKYWFEQQLEAFQSSASEIARQYSDGFKSTDYATNKKYSGGVGYGQDGRNMRTTWTVNFEPSGEEHYASYPTRLIEIPIKAGCPEGGIVYDPFGGTATTAVTAHKLGRKFICSELQPKYAEIANKRLEPYLAQEQLF